MIELLIIGFLVYEFCNSMMGLITSVIDKSVVAWRLMEYEIECLNKRLLFLDEEHFKKIRNEIQRKT